jgi:uncharacterized protein
MKKKYILIFYLLVIILLTGCLSIDNLIKNKEYSKINIDVLEDNIDFKLKNNLKIIHISDLHFERKKNIYSKVLNIINSIKPDILFITGDSIEHKKNLYLLDDFLGKIDPTIIKYSILGNHEYWDDIQIDELKQLYAKYNCKLLINKGDILNVNGNEINIFGTGDYNESKINFNNFIPDDTSLNLVLTHCPIVFDQICKLYPDSKIFVFSGHTHGGEITFFGKPIVLPAGTGNYVKGKFTHKNNTLYVSKGIGSGGILDIRIFANRDIILLKFK